jgi:CBS domain-containing protein
MMTVNLHDEPATKVVLRATNAAELMTPNPVSIRDTATVAEAIALFSSKRFHAAPVIDDAGRPVGVLSGSDILIHERERARFTSADAATSAQTLVRDIMTPVVFSLSPEASPRRVIEDMAALNVHHLYIVDRAGVLIGVISALDIIRRLAA